MQSHYSFIGITPAKPETCRREHRNFFKRGEKMTNLELCRNRFGQQGGTIHDFAKKLDVDVNQLLAMPERLLNTVINSFISNSIPLKMSQLKAGESLIISPAKIQSMMTGVHYVSVDKNYTVTLNYVDGKTETANLKKTDINDKTNLFSFVSAVQAKRNQ